MADGGRDDLLNFIFGRTNEPYRRKANKDPMSEEEEGEDGFKAKYRLTKRSVRALAEILDAEISPKSNANKAYTTIQRLCCVLRLFAGKSFQNAVGDGQHMSQPTISRNLHRVCRALINLGKQLVVFNPDPEVLEATVRGFYNVRGMFSLSKYSD